MQITINTNDTLQDLLKAKQLIDAWIANYPSVTYYSEDGLSVNSNDPIDRLPWTTRAINVFRTQGIHQIIHLISRTENEIKAIPNIGKTTFNEIQHVLKWHGLSLGMKV